MIAIGCDHGGYELKKEIEAYLDSRGLEYRDYGCDSTDSVDYQSMQEKWLMPSLRENVREES